MASLKRDEGRGRLLAGARIVSACLLALCVSFFATAPPAPAATVILKASNAEVMLGKYYEFENPLTGNEKVEGLSVREYRDADYIPGSSSRYDDWQVNSSGIDGWPTEIWLRAAGHAATTRTSLSGAALSVHLFSDDNDGIASIRIDGAEVARIDCYSRPATAILIIVREIAPTPHSVEVRDMGHGMGGDDVAVMGAAIIGDYAPPPARLTFARGQNIADHMWFAGQPDDPNEIISLKVTAGNEAALLDSVEVTASGTGDDSADIAAVWLYLDTNADGVVDIPSDTPLAFSTYPADDTTAVLALSSPLPLAPAQTANLVIAYEMSPGASPTQTYSCAATGATGRSAATGSPAACQGLPISGATKIVMGDLNLMPHLAIADHTWAPVSIDMCATEPNEMISLRAACSPVDSVSWESVTLQSEGTGDDERDICAVQVYLDSDDNGRVGPADVLVGSDSCDADDAALTVKLEPAVIVPAGGALPVLIAYQMRQKSGRAGSTYRVSLAGATGSLEVSRLPASVAVFPISSATKTRNSPYVGRLQSLGIADWHFSVEPWTGAGPPEQKPGVLARVRVLGDPVTYVKLSQLRLQASGDGDDRADITRVLAYEDADANGQIGPQDILLGQAVYPSDNAVRILALIPPLLVPPGQSRDLLIAYVPRQAGKGIAYRFDIVGTEMTAVPPGISADYAGLPIRSATLLRREGPLWAQDPRPFPGASAPGYAVSIGGLAGSNYGSAVVADDWVCPAAAPVTGFHWWGTEGDWMFYPSAFHFAIWTDVPAGVNEPFSHPGEVIWEYHCRDVRTEDPTEDPRAVQPYLLDTAIFAYTPILHHSCLIEDPAARFAGVPGQTYWLSIAAEDAWYDAWAWVLRTRNPLSRAPDAAVSLNSPTAPVLGASWQGGQPLRNSPAPPWDTGGQADAAFRIMTGPVLRIGEVTCLAEPAEIMMAGEVVTANLHESAGYVYVTEPDRSGGMAVAPNEDLLTAEPGDLLFLRGTTTPSPTNNALFTPTFVGKGDRVEPPVPLRLNNRMSGGGQFGWQMGVINRAEAVKPDWAVGLNTVGQLVTMWGRLTSFDAGSQTAWIDDGSLLWDALHPSATGVAVAWPAGAPLPTASTLLQVTGILSTRDSGLSEMPARYLRPRAPADIVVLAYGPM